MCTRCVRYCCQRKEKVLSISNVKYVLLWDNREMKEIKEYINAKISTETWKEESKNS